MNTEERERQMIRELSDAEFNARGLARSRYHDRLFLENKPRPANDQFDEGWSAARNFYLTDAATPPASSSEQARAAAEEIVALVLSFNQLDDLASLPLESENRKHVTSEVAAFLNKHFTAVPVGQDRLINAFRNTAIKCHIGFKHEGPWEECEWIECEDRRKMIDVATSSPVAETPPLTELQQAMVEHDDDMARLDRNTLPAPVVSDGDDEGEHPEDFCKKCGRPNIVWFAPNAIWNQAVRATNEPEILCPVCFVRLAEAAGVNAVWEVAPQNYNAEERKHA